MTLERFTPSAGPDLPPGRYLGRVVSVEHRPEGRFGPFLIWHCEVASGPDLVAVSGTTSTAFGHPNATATRWASAILGTAVGREPLDVAAVVGRRVVLHVALNDRDWPQVQDMETYRADVGGLVPYGPTASGPVAPAPALVPSAPVRPNDVGPAPWPIASAPSATAAAPVAHDDLPF